MNTISLETLLDLSKAESIVYHNLQVTPKNITEIRLECKLPRMTVHYALQRFLRRGIVERIKRNKRFLYFRVPSEKLFSRLFLNQPNLLPESFSIPLTKEAGIAVYHGKNSIYALYERICNENANKRLHTIQTTISTKQIYQQYDLVAIDAIHELMKENNIIVEDIVEEDMFDFVFEKFKKNFPNVMKTFLDRTLVTYVLPKNFISFTNDIILFKDVVVFINWVNQQAIEIRNKELIVMHFNFYDLLKQYSKRAHFKSIIAQYNSIQ